MDRGQKLCWETLSCKLQRADNDSALQQNYKHQISVETDNLANTHQLRQKLQQHSEVPDNDIEAYVPYFNIKDDVDDPEDTRFLSIFATKASKHLKTSLKH